MLGGWGNKNKKSFALQDYKLVKKIPFMLGGWGNKNKKSFALQTINCKEDPFFYSFKKKDMKML